jgi:HAD superfamily hydrolase (TIGR01549 family)
MKNIYEYKAVIFDMDGTLYFQKPFRIRMLLYLVGHVLSHPSSIGDLFIIKKYRNVREHWDMDVLGLEAKKGENLDDIQYEYVAKLKKTTKDRVKNVVEFYMHEVPLKLLYRYRDNELAEIIDKLHVANIKIVVYSDYPAEDKLKALGIKADCCYCSSDERIGTMKPDPKGLGVILNELCLEHDQVLMVGDRYEKDGLAAEGNKIDYIILSASPNKRSEAIKLFTNPK